MSNRDIERLNSAANSLADGLRNSGLINLNVRNRISAVGNETDNNGWWEEVSSWTGRPQIGVSLDGYTSAQQRTFWVGFWDLKWDPIERLYENLSQPATILHDEDARPQGHSWVLNRQLPEELYNCPIAEHYTHEKYYGYYEAAGDLNIERAIEFISGVVLAQEEGEDEASVDVKLIVRNPNLPPTDKEQLIKARRGQGKFRTDLESIWTEGCPISRYTTRELLRASHIMPWREANNTQRVDKYNGILLSANLDALFDKHLITFTDEGKLTISDRLPADEIRRLELSEETTIPLLEAHKPYLVHHRRRFRLKRGLTSA